jgi:predicted GH43/DUF377 family glycosyl hydrolase
MKMLRRLFNACLLRPQDVSPSRDDMEVIGVFNPGAALTESGVVLLLRIAERPKERRTGYVPSPRWDAATKNVVVDWLKAAEIQPVDARVCTRRPAGLTRLMFISHLRVARSRDGRKIDSIERAMLQPGNPYEEFGVEDPRITRMGNTYFLTYVAVSRHGPATALASTEDFRSFRRHGIIFCTENKDVVLFPEKIGGHHHALHRPLGATPFSKPEIWTAASPDLIHWGDHQPLLGGTEAWEIGRVGGGAPPIRTAKGWLAVYHGNDRREGDVGIGAYSAGALLLDLENPRRILGRSGPIFAPETEYERAGFVPDVVFPTGIVAQGETVLVYYGAADTSTAVVEFSLPALLSSMS